MKLIRYLDAAGVVHSGAEQADGTALRISGDVFGRYEITSQRDEVLKRLAPVQPTQILGVGLNYRYHAKEAGNEGAGVARAFCERREHVAASR